MSVATQAVEGFPVSEEDQESVASDAEVAAFVVQADVSAPL